MIGHMKNDGLLDRCHLKGLLGDALHAILCGIGHNLRLLRAHWAALLFLRLFPWSIARSGVLNLQDRPMMA